MKRLCRFLIAALLVSLFQTGFVSASTPSGDVTDPKIKAAVDKLASYGIVDGKSDGKYHPGDDLTRDQFAKMLVQALGLGAAASAATGTTRFSDVAADKWSSGYISVASQQGLVRGRPDGTFGPNENVTYSEAITMVVRALGYKDVWLDGSWPSNYIKKADDLNLIKDLYQPGSSIADRGTAAILLSNTLDAPVVKGVTYDSSGKPVFALDSTGTLASKLVQNGGAVATPAVPAATPSDTGSSTPAPHHHSGSGSGSGSGTGTTTPTYTVTAQSINAESDMIMLNFSEAMDPSTLTLSSIQLGTDVRIDYSDNQQNLNSHLMTAWTNARAVWNGNTQFMIFLNETTDGAILADQKYIGVTMPTGVVKSAAGVSVGSAEVFTSSPVARENQAPSLSASNIDMTAGTLTLNFSEIMDAGHATMSGIQLSKGGITYALSDSSVISTGYRYAVVISLGAHDISMINSNGLTTGAIVLAAGTACDAAGNGCYATSNPLISYILPQNPKRSLLARI